jgi:hypothetical protein
MKNNNEPIPMVNRFNPVEPLIIINDKKTFIRHGRRPESATLSRQLFMPLCPLTVIDRKSLKLIQVLRLHGAIDHTQSATGSSLEFQEWPMQTEWPQELIFPEKTGITI